MIDGTYDTDDDVNDPAEHRRSLSLVKLRRRPVFVNPLERLCQQRENTVSSSRSSEVGGNQGERPPNASLTSTRDFLTHFR